MTATLSSINDISAILNHVSNIATLKHLNSLVGADVAHWKPLFNNHSWELMDELFIAYGLREDEIPSEDWIAIFQTLFHVSESVKLKEWELMLCEKYYSCHDKHYFKMILYCTKLLLLQKYTPEQLQKCFISIFRIHSQMTDKLNEEKESQNDLSVEKIQYEMLHDIVDLILNTLIKTQIWVNSDQYSQFCLQDICNQKFGLYFGILTNFVSTHILTVANMSHRQDLLLKCNQIALLLVCQDIPRLVSYIQVLKQSLFDFELTKKLHNEEAAEKKVNFSMNTLYELHHNDSAHKHEHYTLELLMAHFEEHSIPYDNFPSTFSLPDEMITDDAIRNLTSWYYQQIILPANTIAPSDVAQEESVKKKKKMNEDDTPVWVVYPMNKRMFRERKQYLPKNALFMSKEYPWTISGLTTILTTYYLSVHQSIQTSYNINLPLLYNPVYLQETMKNVVCLLVHQKLQISLIGSKEVLDALILLYPSNGQSIQTHLRQRFYVWWNNVSTDMVLADYEALDCINRSSVAKGTFLHNWSSCNKRPISLQLNTITSENERRLYFYRQLQLYVLQQVHRTKNHWYLIQSWISSMMNNYNQSLRNQSLLSFRAYIDTFDSYSRWMLLTAAIDQCPYESFKGILVDIVKSQCQRAVTTLSTTNTHPMDSSNCSVRNNKQYIDWKRILSSSSGNDMPAVMTITADSMESIKMWVVSEPIQTLLWKHIDPSIALSRRMRMIDIDRIVSVYTHQLLQPVQCSTDDEYADNTNALFWSVLVIPCYCLPKLDNYIHASIDMLIENMDYLHAVMNLLYFVLIKLTFLSEQIIQSICTAGPSNPRDRLLWQYQLQQFFVCCTDNSIEEDNNTQTKLVQCIYDLCALLHEWKKNLDKDKATVVIEDIRNQLKVDLFLQTLTTCCEKVGLFCGYYYLISTHYVDSCKER